MSSATPAPLGLIDPHLALAIGALKAPKHQRAKLAPGVYTVDALVHVKATVTVGEDYEAAQVNKVDPWFLLAVALHHLPERSIEAIVEEAEGLLARKEAGEELGELEEEAVDAMSETAQLAVSRIKAGTTITKKGAVKVEAAVTPLGRVAVAPVVQVTKVGA